MNLPIIKIGNSQGIRIPKTLLDRYQLAQTIELELKDDCIVIKPSASVREGWSAAFSALAHEPEEALMLPDFFPEDDALLDELIGEDVIEI